MTLVYIAEESIVEHFQSSCLLPAKCFRNLDSKSYESMIGDARGWSWRSFCKRIKPATSRTMELGVVAQRRVVHHSALPLCWSSVVHGLKSELPFLPGLSSLLFFALCLTLSACSGAGPCARTSSTLGHDARAFSCGFMFWRYLLICLFFGPAGLSFVCSQLMRAELKPKRVLFGTPLFQNSVIALHCFLWACIASCGCELRS